MYGKPFLLRPILKILVDSCSVDTSFSSLSKRAQSLFKYKDSEFLEFTRTPSPVNQVEIRDIVQFEKEYVSGALRGINIIRKNMKQETAFPYTSSQIEEITKAVFKKPNPDSGDIALTELVFIQAALRWVDELNLLITTERRLLDNRLWFEGHFPSGHLNIMTPEEAVEIVDLYFKNKGKFHLAPRWFANKGLWYWLSFRKKIPYFNVGDQILGALSQRFVFLLMSVDEMGYQYYSGVNNDTMDNTIYHFNYFISLVSGIFDNLAIRTKDQYNLVFKGSDNPCRTSLNNDLGREFLRALRDKNALLRKHINDHVHFIKTIYLLRDVVLHREGLQATSFENMSIDEPWRANFIRVPAETATLLKQCKDKNEDYEPWTHFGIFSESYLEPFKFAKSSVLILADFCNEYLKLLGFKNFVVDIKKNKPQESFVRDLEVFEENNIGL
jgi:hypothetical protein